MNRKAINVINWILGITRCCFGVCLCTKADFGLSMIAAPPYIIHCFIRDFFSWYTQGMSEYVWETVLIGITCSEPEGTVNRLADWGDFIPKLGLASLLLPLRQFLTPIYGNAGYLLDPDSAHNKSYIDPAVWGGYDALGNKDGTAEIVFNSGSIVLYGAAE